ncbi:hypothetical protein EBR43_11075 [bacterium]|nr:hypothetical protein [bacterium]
MSKTCCSASETSKETCSAMVKSMVHPIVVALSPEWKSALNKINKNQDPLSSEDLAYLNAFVAASVAQLVVGVCPDDKQSIEEIAKFIISFFNNFSDEIGDLYVSKTYAYIYGVGGAKVNAKTHVLSKTTSNDGSTRLEQYSMVDLAAATAFSGAGHQLLGFADKAQIDYEAASGNGLKPKAGGGLKGGFGKAATDAAWMLGADWAPYPVGATAKCSGADPDLVAYGAQLKFSGVPPIIYKDNQQTSMLFGKTKPATTKFGPNAASRYDGADADAYTLWDPSVALTGAMYVAGGPNADTTNYNVLLRAKYMMALAGLAYSN